MQLSDRHLGYLVLAAGVALFLILGSLGPRPPEDRPSQTLPAPPRKLSLPPPAHPEISRQAVQHTRALEQRGLVNITYGGEAVTIIAVEPKFWQLLTHQEKEGVVFMFALFLQEQARQQPHLIRCQFFSVLDMTSRRTLARADLLNPQDQQIYQ